MTKILFFSILISLCLKSKNVFILLLSLEVGVLRFLFFLRSFVAIKFIFFLFSFVISSILGLVIFIIIIKKFRSFQTGSFYYWVNSIKFYN